MEEVEEDRDGSNTYSKADKDTTDKIDMLQ